MALRLGFVLLIVMLCPKIVIDLLGLFCCAYLDRMGVPNTVTVNYYHFGRIVLSKAHATYPCVFIHV